MLQRTAILLALSCLFMALCLPRRFTLLQHESSEFDAVRNNGRHLLCSPLQLFQPLIKVQEDLQSKVARMEAQLHSLSNTMARLVAPYHCICVESVF